MIKGVEIDGKPLNVSLLTEDNRLLIITYDYDGSYSSEENEKLNLLCSTLEEMKNSKISLNVKGKLEDNKLKYEGTALIKILED